MQERFYSIDYLRVLMAVFVVLGHSSYGHLDVGRAWIAGGNSLFRAAVPVFAVISGFFLLRTLECGKFLPWCKRILGLYVVWSLIYYAFVAAISDASWISIRSFILGFWHLWFLEGLVIAALMLATLRGFGARILIGSAAICAIIGVVLQYADLLGYIDIPIEYYRNGPFFLFPFVTMGYLLAIERRKGLAGHASFRISGPLLFVIAALGLCLSLAENLIQLWLMDDRQILEIPSGLYLMCPAIFVLALRTNLPASGWPLARISSAIYILHVLFIFGLQELLGLSVPVTVLLALIVPALLVLLQDRTARGRRWMSWAF